MNATLFLMLFTTCPFWRSNVYSKPCPRVDRRDVGRRLLHLHLWDVFDMYPRCPAPRRNCHGLSAGVRVRRWRKHSDVREKWVINVVSRSLVVNFVWRSAGLRRDQYKRNDDE